MRKNLLFIHFVLMVTTNIAFAYKDATIETKLFSNGIILGQLDAFGNDILREYLVKSGPECSVLALPHCTAEIPNDQKAVVTILGDPVKRAIRLLRTYKSEGYESFCALDLNKLEDIQKVIQHCQYLSFFAPQGVVATQTELKADQVDQCVAFALKTMAFVGNFEDLKNSMHRLNMQLGLSLNVSQFITDVEKKDVCDAEEITNPDVLEYLRSNLQSEILFTEKVLAGQKWRMAAQRLKRSRDERECLVQLILPQDFEPEGYIRDQKLGEVVDAVVGAEKWKRHEVAVRHFIAHDTGGSFEIERISFPESIVYELNFMNASWPGVISSTQGLSYVEQSGSWSDGPIVTFNFEHPLPNEFFLHFEAIPYGTNKGKEFKVRVDNDEKPFVLGSGVVKKIIKLTNGTGDKSLTFTVPIPQLAKDKVGGGDRRKLGIGFTRLWIESAH